MLLLAIFTVSVVVPDNLNEDGHIQPLLKDVIYPLDHKRIARQATTKKVTLTTKKGVSTTTTKKTTGTTKKATSTTKKSVATTKSGPTTKTTAKKGNLVSVSIIELLL